MLYDSKEGGDHLGNMGERKGHRGSVNEIRRK
jgi:hypothetical protein